MTRKERLPLLLALRNASARGDHHEAKRLAALLGHSYVPAHALHN